MNPTSTTTKLNLKMKLCDIYYYEMIYFAEFAALLYGDFFALLSLSLSLAWLWT